MNPITEIGDAIDLLQREASLVSKTFLTWEEVIKLEIYAKEITVLAAMARITLAGGRDAEKRAAAIRDLTYITSTFTTDKEYT